MRTTHGLINDILDANQTRVRLVGVVDDALSGGERKRLNYRHVTGENADSPDACCHDECSSVLR